MEVRSGDGVCVIGAGPAGLATAVELSRAGIDFVCLDQRPGPGGVWSSEVTAGLTHAWPALTLNSPRGWFELSDHPMPRSYPDFPRADQVSAYLDSCLDHYAIRDRFEWSTGVTAVEPRSGGRWRVTLTTGEVRDFAAVVVANGHHNEPLLPDLPGEFTGGTRHSQTYRDREQYAGKRVLVVGFGNSGSQIAADVSGVAAATVLSIRRGGYVLPHYARGLRIDRAMPAWLGFLVNAYLPRMVVGPLLTAFYRLVVGSPTRSGLPAPDHHFGSALPTVTAELPDLIDAGLVRVRPQVSRLAGRVVEFTDGSREEVDEIVWCTGYRTTTPFLDEDIFRSDDNRVPLYLRVFHPEHPSLHFVGLLQAVGWGFLPLFESQARLVAAHLSGRYRLPEPARMREAIAADQQRVRRDFVDSSRNRYQMNGAVYQHECRVELRRGARRSTPVRT
ncbi:Predicted flavoprotein CzcO associated with the cation diffusion facilitator CzcD [Nocardioides alpinus]|uniref:Monooxygenase n=1 Tax=Nocardioides alpinus TaxID=748909 RepID=A0A1I1BE65_9ACTN|nr:FAD-dependent oxidoreductase [Nocardioides alpinus]PKH38425.1 monooxygenase [Nocardioides alpinus]SFB48581.1 Predicted flavoprotein CzcO associated with the cation diffusion facilitator CzcD [Nocardioides alpinus]